MSNETKFIYFRESAWQSVLADIVTFLIPIGGFYVNYRFIGNNGFLAVVLVILTALYIMGYGSGSKKKYTDKAKLIKDLQDGIL